MVRRTSAEAQATRGHILDAAMQLFEAEGVSKVSLEAIARQAGLTRGAIYWHFRNKTELLTAMVERATGPLHLFTKLTAMERDPMAFLRAATRDFLKKFDEEPNFLRVFEILWHKCEFVGDTAEIRRKYLDEGENHIAIIERAFTIAREKKQIAFAMTPRQAAFGLVSLIDGMIFNWTKSPAFPIEQYGQCLLEAFFRGLDERAAAYSQ